MLNTNHRILRFYKRVFNLKSASPRQKSWISILVFLFFNFAIYSQPPVRIKEQAFFKEISKKYFAKILLSKERAYQWKGEQMVSYSSCGEEFPKLIGGFPCSFLSDEISSGNEQPEMDIEGGKVALKISKENSIFGGKVFLISDEEEKDRNEFLILAFYNKDNFISHYFHKNYVVIFKWIGKGTEKTLTEIFQIKLNSKKEILSIQRISFE